MRDLFYLRHVLLSALNENKMYADKRYYITIISIKLVIKKYSKRQQMVRRLECVDNVLVVPLA